MTPQQLLAVVRARWPIIACVAAATFVLVMVVTALLPKRYTSTAQVLVDTRKQDLVLGAQAQVHAQPTTGYMATQVDIVASPRVAVQVVERLGLARTDDCRERWQARTGGLGSLEHFCAEQLLRKLDVRPSKESSVINISYTAKDAATSAAVANGFARAYIDTNVDIKVEPARQTHGFFDEQTQALRERLELARKRLSDQQKASGIVSSEERDDVDNTRLADLSQQLTTVQASVVETAKRLQVAEQARREGRLDTLPEVLANPLVGSLKADLARIDSRYRERSTALGPEHPELVRMRSEAASLSERLQAEMSTVVIGLSRQHQVLVRREAELEATLRRQRDKLLTVKGQRDEIAVLQQELEAAQRAYDAAALRHSQTSLESESRQGNVVLLTAAVAPGLPTSPKVAVNAALGGVLGLLLGVVSAVGVELRSRRIRSLRDLAQSCGLPVLGTVRRLPRRLKEAPLPLQGRGGAAAIDVGLLDNMATIIDTGAEPAALAPAPVPARGEVAAAAPPPRRKKRIGEILVEANLLAPIDVEPLLAAAGTSGLRFGETAVARRKVTAAQVRQALAFQFDFPVLEPGASAVSGEVFAAYEGRHPLVADLRKLRTQIHARWLAKQAGAWPPKKAVAVVSPNRGDGKSFVAANLAVAFSQLGERTLLIDADLRRGRMHDLFGLDNRVGLTALLNRQNPLGALRRIDGLRDLTVVTSGAEAPNPSDLLSREVFGLLLASFGKDYDVIIVDTPNSSDEPDAEAVARCTQACVVVGRAGHTGFEAIGALTQQLAALEVATLGTIFVDA